MEQIDTYRIPSEATLIAFESVARLGSFSHAAAELGTARSTVMRRVADLERQLATRLLEPSRMGLAPTEEGRRLYEAVARGLRIIEEAVAEADAPPTGRPPDQ